MECFLRTKRSYNKRKKTIGSVQQSEFFSKVKQEVRQTKESGAEHSISTIQTNISSENIHCSYKHPAVFDFFNTICTSKHLKLIVK